MAFPKNCSREIAKRLGVPEVEVLAAALASQAYPSWAPSTAGGPVFLEGSDAALASAIDRLHDGIGMKLSRDASDDHREPGYGWGNVDPLCRDMTTVTKRHCGTSPRADPYPSLEKTMNTLVDEVVKIRAETAAAAREKLLRRYRLEVSVESPDAKTLAKLSADLGFDAATVGKHLSAVREARKVAESTSVWGEAQYLEELKVLNTKHAALEVAKLQLEKNFNESRRQLGEVTQRRTFHSDKLNRLAALKKANPEIFPADAGKA